MSYPKTSEQRLIQLFGYSYDDLMAIWGLCNQNKAEYEKRLEELDRKHSMQCFQMIMDERTFVH